MSNQRLLRTVVIHCLELRETQHNQSNMKISDQWEEREISASSFTKPGFLLTQQQFAPQCQLFRHCARKSSTLLHGGNIEKLNRNKNPELKNYCASQVI